MVLTIRLSALNSIYRGLRARRREHEEFASRRISELCEYYLAQGIKERIV
mgnify:CR=1